MLLHSLLLGPRTWAPVAAELTAAGATVVMPTLIAGEDLAATVNAALAHLPGEQPIVLVAHSNAGLWVPAWTTWWPEADVTRLFPDAETRAAVEAEQPRLPVSYYEQRIPAPAGWDDRPCGYLVFGPPYDAVARDARDRGWTVAEVPGGHLHQLTDPGAVAAVLRRFRTWTPPA